MKLVFIFPFANNVFGLPIKWLPMSSSTLVGNLKDKIDPDIDFYQLDIEEEVRTGILDKKLKNQYWNLLNNFIIKDKASILDKDFNINKDLSEFKYLLKDIVEYLDLAKYDHYLFSFYNRSKTGIKAHVLLAKYLKTIYPNKKIIFGGIIGHGDDYMKQSFEEFGFIDSFVIGRGELALLEIINNLFKNKPIKKVYFGDKITELSKQMSFKGLVDFNNFKSFNHFYFSTKDLRNFYNNQFLDLKKQGKKNEKIVFIPYFFSKGCFWGKCKYCNNSGSNKTNHKSVEEIIKDLIGLKKKYQTRYFVFYNSNFNFNLTFAKNLLKELIKNKLEILWTDSFNLIILDDEIIDLLVKAGCFRMDLGVTILDPKLQQKYNNIIQDNKYLENLKKLSQKGIWTHINLIVNLPYQYSIKKDKEILNKYMKYIDGISLNYYRRYPYSDLSINYKKYGLNIINKEIFLDKNKARAKMVFIENDFSGSLQEREEIFKKNYLALESFLKNHKKSLTNPNMVHLYLLGYLYNIFGFKNKDKIKKIVKNSKNQLLGSNMVGGNVVLKNFIKQN